MRFRSLVVLACGLLWLSSQPVAAGIVQYNYVGMPFAVTSGSPPSSVTNISGDFQFNQALVPLPTSAPDDITSLITAFSFTDGNQTLTKLNTSSFSFQITLDSSGALVGPWEIDIGNLSAGQDSRHFRLRQVNAATTLPERTAIWLQSNAFRVSIMPALDRPQTRAGRPGARARTALCCHACRKHRAARARLGSHGSPG